MFADAAGWNRVIRFAGGAGGHMSALQQIAFTRGARAGVVMIRMPVVVKTASNASVYLASRSLIRNFKPSLRSPKPMSVFLACCTVHAAVG
jgi:hypothetical protein